MSENEKTYGVFDALIDIIAAPGKALDGVKGHNKWMWAPLITTIVLGIAAFGYYISWVDWDWYKDFLIQQGVDGGQPRDQVEAGMEVMSPGLFIGLASAMVIIFTFLFYSIQAGYLHLVTKLTGSQDTGFGDWFALTCWTSFVSIFNAIAMFVVILMASSNQLEPWDLTPLSLNSLIFHFEPGADFMFKLMSSITLVHFWMLFLTSLGVSRWTKSSLGKGFAIALPIWLALGLIGAVMQG